MYTIFIDKKIKNNTILNNNNYNNSNKKNVNQPTKTWNQVSKTNISDSEEDINKSNNKNCCLNIYM